MSDRNVQGYCPMGCGHTLFVGNGGYITCSYLQCPNASAVSQMLDECETEHVVRIEDERFHVQHPLRERLPSNGDWAGRPALLDCGLHGWLSELEGPPRKPGLYRVQLAADGSTWNFTELVPESQEQK